MSRMSNGSSNRVYHIKQCFSYGLFKIVPSSSVNFHFRFNHTLAQLIPFICKHLHILKPSPNKVSTHTHAETQIRNKSIQIQWTASKMPSICKNYLHSIILVWIHFQAFRLSICISHHRPLVFPFFFSSHFLCAGRRSGAISNILRWTSTPHRISVTRIRLITVHALLLYLYVRSLPIS